MCEKVATKRWGWKKHPVWIPAIGTLQVHFSSITNTILPNFYPLWWRFPPNFIAFPQFTNFVSHRGNASDSQISSTKFVQKFEIKSFYLQNTSESIKGSKEEPTIYCLFCIQIILIPVVFPTEEFGPPSLVTVPTHHVLSAFNSFLPFQHLLSLCVNSTLWD